MCTLAFSLKKHMPFLSWKHLYILLQVESVIYFWSINKFCTRRMEVHWSKVEGCTTSCCHLQMARYNLQCMFIYVLSINIMLQSVAGGHWGSLHGLVYSCSDWSTLAPISHRIERVTLLACICILSSYRSKDQSLSITTHNVTNN